ncbi:hypothetical protein ES703_96050 [subsurface metagenome]
MTNITKIPDKKSLLLDTLAQPGTELTLKPEKSLKNTLERRAIAKFVTNGIIYPLIDLDTNLKKSYWRSFHCTRILLQDGKKITSRYCNNRWCVVCNRIRTAKMINNYLPVLLNEIKEPYFVTLTIPNCTGQDLRATINHMIKTVIKINSTCRHRRDYQLKGIRKLECTYNQLENTFHPHFHFIINTYQVGQELISAWLENYPEARSVSQDIRRADKNSLIELFKYTTKITAGTLNKSDEAGNRQVELNIIPEALDVIFQAMYGKRVYQPIGIKKIQQNEDMESIEGIQSEDITDIAEKMEVWGWEQDVSDWISGAGELLTGCTAHERYKVKTSAVEGS